MTKPNAVVAPEGLEAAQVAVEREVVRKLLGETDPSENYVARLARAAFEAAGIVVADDVVGVRGDSPIIVGFDTPERVVHIMLKRGDTIYIKRAVTVSHSKEA